MTEHPNAEVLLQGYAAFGKGDMDTVRQVLAEDIRWHSPGRNQLSGDYQGQDEVLALFGKIQQLAGGTFALDIHDVLASDEHVVVITDARAERDGRALPDGRAVHVWHMRDGKATEFWAVPLDPYGTDEFWA